MHIFLEKTSYLLQVVSVNPLQAKSQKLLKGQLTSKCPFGVIVWTKIPTKKFPRFLPKPLRRGQIKKFIKPIMLISIIRGYLT